MRKLRHFLLLPMCAAASLAAQAAPVMVPALKATAQTYSFFYTDTQQLSKKGINPTVFKQDIANQLAPQGALPCWTLVDQNDNNMRCGDPATGQMQLAFDEFFSYTGETLLPKATLVVDRNATFKQVMVANFLTSATGVPADVFGRTGRIHFTTRVAQFGLLVDPGTATSIQFIVNNQALPPQPLTAGVTQFVAVEDPHGFSDVTLIAGGPLGQGFIADRLGFVPLSRF